MIAPVLYQGLSKTAILENIDKRNDRQGHAHQPEILRQQNTGQDCSRYELNNLGNIGGGKTPEKGRPYLTGRM
jgi:hypothetical protein